MNRIIVIGKYPIDTTIDELATKQKYKVVIDKYNSAICDGGENNLTPGQQVLEVIDKYKLLQDRSELFPTFALLNYKIFNFCSNLGIK